MAHVPRIKSFNSSSTYMAKRTQRSPPIRTPLSSIQTPLSSVQDDIPPVTKRPGCPPKRAVPANDNISTEDTLSVNAERLASNGGPTHRYLTRAAKKRYPAETFGLRKDPDGEVSTVVNEKTSAENTVAAERPAVQEQHEVNGADDVGALDDQHILKDQSMSEDDPNAWKRFSPTQREGWWSADEPFVHFVNGELVEIDAEEEEFIFSRCARVDVDEFLAHCASIDLDGSGSQVDRFGLGGGHGGWSLQRNTGRSQK
ncbi:hypothetical protein BD410DRAFT_810556 [Rickenella mellea]|uniref:Uncharacterized protein n=1 Tax=Rickenella mellea TaxID=50990 RepID=A0A4Y7PGF7_9AGAM|nr:hypothetical protein BD410DRAFT_810556 [Rickenella mellea]